jgi:hypothetical protein
MNSQSFIILFFLIIACEIKLCIAQKPWSISAEVFSSVSSFSINKKSPEYNSNWEKIDVSFKPKLGMGLAMGLQYAINDKIGFWSKIRYSRWGGYIQASNISLNPVFNYQVDFDINYQSFNFPFAVNYVIKSSERYRISLNAGLGIDNAFHLKFTPRSSSGNNRNGRGDTTLTNNINIKTTYILLGGEVSFNIKNNHSVYTRAEINSDRFFNGERLQDFGSFFGQENIPLHYQQLQLAVGYRF